MSSSCSCRGLCPWRTGTRRCLHVEMLRSPFHFLPHREVEEVTSTCSLSTCRSAYTQSPPPHPHQRSCRRGWCRRRRGRRGGRGSSTRPRREKARETWGGPKIRIRILIRILSRQRGLEYFDENDRISNTLLQISPSTKVEQIDTYMWGSLSRDMI